MKPRLDERHDVRGKRSLSGPRARGLRRLVFLLARMRHDYLPFRPVLLEPFQSPATWYCYAALRRYATFRPFPFGFACAASFGPSSIVTWSILPVNANGSSYVKSIGEQPSMPTPSPPPSENLMGIVLGNRPPAIFLPLAVNVIGPPLPMPPPSYLKSTTSVVLPFGNGLSAANVKRSTDRKL